ncbi:FAD-linked oxidase [Marinobacterium nitratireducens]|uniref:FAD-linked oxidase n=1 Tax=Marinobacterium nitratireducens TaxID=518897 RepID=A0A918DQ76_9GAMM|nr:FAD-binding oxidoreductase [Marinobacterium nitratireducens]GGO76832.1 FAD-linked oxidase [Marinobacterium nitratireducens]
MSHYSLKRLDGGVTMLPEAAVETFAAELRGELLTPDSAHYDWARTVWNAMIDRRPGLIARCVVQQDVRCALEFARENGLLLSVKSGGHNVAGNAVCDDGLMIDLSPMRWVRVDPKKQVAQVGAGALLGDLDRESLAHGLVTPLGINSTTGVAGLTLGGGFGWLSRRFGLSVDNLLSVDLVGTDGQCLHASEDEHPELFWALRGGGGNFGIVTSFEFKLHPFEPEVVAGLVLYPLEHAASVMRQYREYAAVAPDCLSAWCVLRKAPPLPFLSVADHGREVLALAVCYSGARQEADALIEPLRHFGTPLGEHLGPVPYTGWQTTFDPLLAPGARNYWKSHNFRALNDAVIDELVTAAGMLPSEHCEIFVGQLGGVINLRAPQATAYPHRDVEFVINMHARWESADDDKVCKDWSRRLFDALAEHATGGVYVNFMTADEEARVEAAYGPNQRRLIQLKQRYDPDNLLRINQNIHPSSEN